MNRIPRFLLFKKSPNLIFSPLQIGVDMIRPWGWVQSYCCGLRRKTRHKLKKELSVIPLVSDPGQSPPVSQEVSHRVTALQDRNNALEVFLREYVVDVKYLEKLKGIDIESDNNNLNHNGGARVVP